MGWAKVQYARLICSGLIIQLMCAPVAIGAPEVLGWLEGGYLQPWGVRVRAKLDTGALTSSIHAENIEIFRANDKDWVRFLFPYGKKEGYPTGFMIERPILRESHVKERGGGLSSRYVIGIDICVSGNTFPVEVSLADRDNFNYPIILGRRALSGRFVVDPGKSFAGNRSCPRRNRKTGKITRR